MGRTCYWNTEHSYDHIYMHTMWAPPHIHTHKHTHTVYTHCFWQLCDLQSLCTLCTPVLTIDSTCTYRAIYMYVYTHCCIHGTCTCIYSYGCMYVATPTGKKWKSSSSLYMCALLINWWLMTSAMCVYSHTCTSRSSHGFLSVELVLKGVRNQERLEK